RWLFCSHFGKTFDIILLYTIGWERGNFCERYAKILLVGSDAGRFDRLCGQFGAAKVPRQADFQVAPPETGDGVHPDDRPAENAAGCTGRAVYHCCSHNPSAAAVQGRNREISAAIGGWKLYRNGSDAV